MKKRNCKIQSSVHKMSTESLWISMSITNKISTSCWISVCDLTVDMESPVPHEYLVWSADPETAHKFTAMMRMTPEQNWSIQIGGKPHFSLDINPNDKISDFDWDRGPHRVSIQYKEDSVNHRYRVINQSASSVAIWYRLQTTVHIPRHYATIITATFTPNRLHSGINDQIPLCFIIQKPKI